MEKENWILEELEVLRVKIDNLQKELWNLELQISREAARKPRLTEAELTVKTGY